MNYCTYIYISHVYRRKYIIAVVMETKFCTSLCSNIRQKSLASRTRYNCLHMLWLM